MNRRIGRPVVVALAMLAAAALLDVAADRTRHVVDLTAERSLSLTAQTHHIAAAVHRSTEVTAFLQPDDPDRAPAAALLLRYQRLNRRIRFRILDPRRATGELRRLGVDPDLGGVAVAQGRSVEVVPTLTEQDITGALARLERGRSARLCFTSGHGEASIDDDGGAGLVDAVALLKANGYSMRAIDLLAEPAVPDDCDGVIMASPRSDLGDAATKALSNWLAADGRLLLLADPASTAPLGPVVADLHLGLRRGIVLEGDPQAALPQDPSAPIIRTYSSASPIVRRLPPTFFPGLQEVTVGASDTAHGLVVNRLADTSALSYLETEPLTSTFDPAADHQGPITVAASADRSRLDGQRIHRTRVVVVGDVDFATNAALHQAANSTFLVRALDWLTLDDQLVVLSANLPLDRRLTLTRARLTYARFVTLAVVPGLFLLLGLGVWLMRRPR